MTCTTCNGYELVEVAGEHEKVQCPDCATVKAAKVVARSFAAERVARIRTGNRPAPSNRAPVSFKRCPVHNSKVGVDGEGRLLGRCDGCMSDYAIALRRLSKMRRRAA